MFKSKPANTSPANKSDMGRILGDSLKKLREMAGVTQKELAKKLSVGQAAISKLEQRGDIQLSSLHQYVQALGAKLHIDASFSAKNAPKAISDLSTPLGETDQLVFPLLAQLPRDPGRDIILSIRPQYSEKIIQGQDNRITASLSVDGSYRNSRLHLFYVARAGNGWLCPNNGSRQASRFAALDEVQQVCAH